MLCKYLKRIKFIHYIFDIFADGYNSNNNIAHGMPRLYTANKQNYPKMSFEYHTVNVIEYSVKNAILLRQDENG